MDSQPSIRYLKEWIAVEDFDDKLPEVAALRGVEQPREYHGEGDAYIHTLLAVQAVPDDADIRVFWAVLLHDIGKAITTAFVDGHWRARGHGEAGTTMVPAIMERFGMSEICDDVSWLVRHHDFILSWNLGMGDRLTARQHRFTEHRLFPLLLQVNAADAAASWGKSCKGEIGQALAAMILIKE